MAVVAVFDFLSHAAMHLPFNEAYLRTLRAAFPEDVVEVFAQAPHVAALSPRLADDAGVTLHAVSGFRVPFGLSRHNPLGGWLAGRDCLATMRAAIGGRALRMAAVLGADANLHAALRGGWPGISAAMLHVVIHNHIAAGVQWRSRNPVLRHFDMRARLQGRLPANMRLVALELGVAEAVAGLAPALVDAVVTLEHPILVSEWGPPGGAEGQGPLRIGFLGHASADKGFDRFAAWARQSAGPERSFHAVGLASGEAARMDLSGLATPPSPSSVPRDAYVALLASCDLICLPLSPIYDYVASGSVIDAIAALKPLYCVRNRSFSRIVAKYGEIGVLADDEASLGATIGALTRPHFAAVAPAWRATMQAIRAARAPAALATEYRRTIAG